MRSLIVPLQEQAHALMEQDLGEAAWRYRKVLLFDRWHRGVSAKDRFDAYIQLGLVHYIRGKYARAARIWERALALAERKIGPMSIEVATALDRLVYASMARAEVAATWTFEANGGWNSVTTASHGRMLWQAAFDRSPHRAQGLGYARRRDLIEEQLQAHLGSAQ